MKRNDEQLMNNRYFLFLRRIVGGAKNYGILLHQLHRMEFYSLIPNDDNRAGDGRHVRDDFCDEEGPQGLSLCPSGPCTVLEMLIGLSYRLEWEVSQSDYERKPREWFWLLVENLGLMEFTDQAFQTGYEVEEVMAIVDKFLERRYSVAGVGGLFPLRNPQKDQRNVEIWYQMTYYMMENYPI